MKNLYCIIGVTLLLSSFYLSYLSLDNKNVNNFKNMLNKDQREKYDEIIKERLYIYYLGYFIGIVFSYFYYIKYPKSKYLVCKLLSISFIVNMLFYKFYPKKPLILYHLTTKNQINAWADLYTSMKKNILSSIIFGLLGSIIISYSLK